MCAQIAPVTIAKLRVMLRRLLPVALFVLSTGVAFALRPAATPTASPASTPKTRRQTIVASAPTIAQKATVKAAPAVRDNYKVLGSYPHETSAFTQGLVWSEGGFYESTGLNGQSTLRRVAFPSGKVVKQAKLAEPYFAEGLALRERELVQLTWQNGVGFVYDTNFKPLRSFPVPTEGWGLTFDGAQFVRSDGSDALYFLDPKTFATTKTVRVTWNGQPLRMLNELEAINGQIWANVWQTDFIVRINPQTGRVMSYLDLSELFPHERRGRADVLNGIAYDAATQRVFVTGKLWPKLYVLRVSDAA